MNNNKKTGEGLCQVHSFCCKRHCGNGDNRVLETTNPVPATPEQDL